jgi:prepilin-type N-terminal cleavage/methylation domain-containing protein
MPSGPEPSPMSGFTLVETLVAMALLAMALTSIGRLVLTSRHSLEGSLAASRAHQQADALVAALQALPAGHPWLESGVVLHPRGGSGMRLEGAVHPWPGAGHLQRVEVSASWRRLSGGRRNFHLQALRHAGGRP